MLPVVTQRVVVAFKTNRTVSVQQMILRHTDMT